MYWTGAEHDCQVVTGKGDPFLLCSKTVEVVAGVFCLFWRHRWPKMKVYLPGQSLSLEHLPCPAQCKCEVRSPCRSGVWTHKASAGRSFHAHGGAGSQGSE